MPGEWKEVRRSVPAEHVSGVPDSATTWAVWIRGDDTVTIYQDERKDDTGPYGVFWVVEYEHERQTGTWGPMSENEALDKAERIRTESYIM